MSRIIDLRNRAWGNALHGYTWEERTVRRGWLFRRVRQATVLAHVSGRPAIGDLLLYTSSIGPTVADVVGVDRAPTVDDLYALTLENIRPATAKEIAG